MMMMMMMMMSELFAVCLLSDWESAQKRTVPFFAWSLLESVGLTDVQLQPDSEGKTERLRLHVADGRKGSSLLKICQGRYYETSSQTSHAYRGRRSSHRKSLRM